MGGSREGNRGSGHPHGKLQVANIHQVSKELFWQKKPQTDM